ncbi:MAG: hypothetical protein QQN63_06430 [Nitrosopumilus sp.]
MPEYTIKLTRTVILHSEMTIQADNQEDAEAQADLIESELNDADSGRMHPDNDMYSDEYEITEVA